MSDPKPTIDKEESDEEEADGDISSDYRISDGGSFASDLSGQ